MYSFIFKISAVTAIAARLSFTAYWMAKFFVLTNSSNVNGNFNCGTRGLHDEYCSSKSTNDEKMVSNNLFIADLYVQENILLMIVYGTCLVAVMIFFLVQILRVCVPTVAEHFFIFKESEENQFVLTSQSLPPLKEVKGSEDENQREIRNEQFLQRKRASINPLLFKFISPGFCNLVYSV
jgi:hypothetical protein